jgi:hypothetical protein
MINTSSVQIIWRLQTELTIGQTGNDFIISEQRPNIFKEDSNFWGC